MICEIFLGVWFNGRIGVSKTFGEGSIPSTPAINELQKNKAILALFFLLKNLLIHFLKFHHRHLHMNLEF